MTDQPELSRISLPPMYSPISMKYPDSRPGRTSVLITAPQATLCTGSAQRKTVAPSIMRRLPPPPPVRPLCPDRLSTATAGPTFYKTTNVRMSLDAAKEAALRSIFPQHDIQLSCVIEDVFVVGLGRKSGV